MKVKAKINLNYNGVWKRPGDVFEIPATDEDVAEYVELMETPLAGAEEPEAPRRRGRPRRADVESA